MAGRSLIQSLMFHLIQDGFKIKLSGQSGQSEDNRIAKALGRIHQEFDTDLTVTDLARDARLSAVQFRKRFRQVMAVSPKAYIARYRLTVAADWLRSDNLSIKEIAFGTGFRSDHYFHLCFKQQYGCTPSEFRRARQEMM